MSGIAGYISIKENVGAQRLHKMLNVIKHRGPDNEGYYFFNNHTEQHAYGEGTLKEVIQSDHIAIEQLYGDYFTIGLGFRGIKINEPFKDYHQPKIEDDLVIVFDGNIYNYKMIKKQLEDLGNDFITETDVEVVIKAYKQWGKNCVQRFNGDWAFVVWDKKNRKLFCSRDRIGIRPFYYYFDGNTFIFSSEIKQILEYGIKPKVNEKMLFAFLFYGFDSIPDETFFKEIYCLGGAEDIELELNYSNMALTLNRNKYWEIKSSIKNVNDFDFEIAANNTGLALTKSIEHRLRCDVEVGSCLSGGLDSSSIVTLVCEHLNKRGKDTRSFKTFTACYDNAKEVDERHYSNMVVEKSGCRNYEVKPIAEKLKKELERIIWHQEEPFGGFSVFAGWCVMETASKNGVKVILDGQGGDETLLGYERYYSYMLVEKFKKFNIAGAFKEFKLAINNSKLTTKMLLAFLLYFSSPYIRKKRLQIKNNKFINPAFCAQFANKSIVNDLIKFSSFEDVKTDAIVNSISHLLKFEDKNSMAHSIEARVPFLDHEFVEMAFNLPTEYKLKNGWTKACLRKFMESKMPWDVTYRKNKLGFSVPQGKWIDELNDHFANRLLSNPVSRKYFNMDFIRTIFRDKTYPEFRVKFVIVELWMRVFKINET